MKYIMLFEELVKKNMLGSGENAGVFPSKVYPDRVIKQYDPVHSKVDLQVMSDVTSKHPEIFGKFFSVDVKRGVVVQEKMNLLPKEHYDRLISFLDGSDLDEFKEGGLGFKDQTSPFQHDFTAGGVKFDIFYLWLHESLIGEDMDIIDRQISTASQESRTFFSACKKLCTAACRILGVHELDFGWDNIGYTEEGELRLLDY